MNTTVYCADYSYDAVGFALGVAFLRAVRIEHDLAVARERMRQAEEAAKVPMDGPDGWLTALMGG